MRLSRRTIEWVLLASLALIAFGYFLDLYPDLWPARDGYDLSWVGHLIFYVFAVDYLTIKDPFFKSKFFMITRFGLGLVMLAVLFRILHLPYADLLLIGSAAILPLSYAAWALSLEEFDLRATLNSILFALFSISVFGRMLHLPIPDLLVQLVLPFAIVLVGIQWYRFRNRSSKNVS